MFPDRLRPIRIGISACLLGEQVRFDGGHKCNPFLTETLGRLVEWVPVCPEVECGFGTPREAMRLVRAEDGVRLLTVKTGIDLTARMERYSMFRFGYFENSMTVMLPGPGRWMSLQCRAALR